MDTLLYHTHHSLFREDIPFWLSIAEQQAGAILELGCGTGRVTQPLIESGKCVYGLDHDADMIDFLRLRLSQLQQRRVYLVQADMNNYHFSMKFGAIIVPCNTLSTLSYDELHNTLANAYRHMQRGGIFAASLPNPTRLAALPDRGDPVVEEIFEHPDDGETVLASSEWRRDGETIVILWHYDHLSPFDESPYETVQTRHIIFPVNLYRSQLPKVGFREIKLYGDFDRQPYSNDSPYLIMKAIR